MYSYTPEDSGGILPKPYLGRNENNKYTDSIRLFDGRTPNVIIV